VKPQFQDKAAPLRGRSVPRVNTRESEKIESMPTDKSRNSYAKQRSQMPTQQEYADHHSNEALRQIMETSEQDRRLINLQEFMTIF